MLRHPAPVHHTESLIALRALDLSRFRIFDLDAYGGPWAEVAVIAARRRLQPGESLAIVITDGSVRRAMLGRVTRELAALAGVPASGMGAHRRWTDLARRALDAAAEQMGGRLASLRESDLPHHSLGMWHGLAVIEAG